MSHSFQHNANEIIKNTAIEFNLLPKSGKVKKDNCLSSGNACSKEEVTKLL